MRTWKAHILVAALALLAGCGGGNGGGGGSTSALFANPVRVNIAWPERSREVNAFTSALSASVTLSRAAEDGSDASVLIKRQSGPNAYSADATLPGKIRVGAWALTVRFYAQDDGTGAVVGEANADVRVMPGGSLAKPDGTPLGTIQTVGRVARVEIVPGQAVTIGAPIRLAFVAMDASNNVLALSPGSAFFNVISGLNLLAVDLDGTCHGIKEGVARVTVSVDEAVGGPEEVLVQSYAQILSLNLQSNDIVYDPHSGKLFASVPSTDSTGHGNSIVAIDPQTMAITASVAVGSEPGRLALSDDGQFLYVGLRGAPDVCRVDLATMSVGLRFTLGFDPFFGPRFAEYLAVVPGIPHAVAVTAQYRGVYPAFAGLLVYDDGLARPNAPSHDSTPRPVSDAIAFGATPSRLYGDDEEGAGYGLTRMTVDSTGIVSAESAGGIGGVIGPIVFAGGLLYASNGQVANPETATPAGSFDLGQDHSGMWPTGGFAIDSKSNRAYFLTSDTFNTHFTLTAFDRTSFAKLGSHVITTATGSVAYYEVPRLVLCGTGRLAFSAHNDNDPATSQIIFVSPIPGS